MTTITAREQRLRFIASNIVNQLADHYSERISSPDWVPVRQASNDALDSWVYAMIRKAITLCPRCDGAGFVIGLDGYSEPCNTCDGFGEVP